jgi:hypothetical protein
VKQVLKRAPQPVDRPCGEHVIASLDAIAEGFVEARSTIAAFGAADATVPIDLYDLPALGVSELVEFSLLIHDSLPVCRYPDV